jgi:hypothetical protein
MMSIYFIGENLMEETKDKQKERTKKYYHSNKEELLKKQVEYRAKNKERIAERKKTIQRKK